MRPLQNISIQNADGRQAEILLVEFEPRRAVVPFVDAGVSGPQTAEAAGGPGGDEFAFAAGFFVAAAFVEVSHEAAVHRAHKQATSGVHRRRDAAFANLMPVPDGEVPGFDFLLVVNELDAGDFREVGFFKNAGHKVFQREGGEAE